jgi:C1A family cysteine protease
MKTLVVVGAFALVNGVAAAQSLPAQFDLRNVDGQSFVSAVKSQSGGTCWTHGTMAAVESNLLITGEWYRQREAGEANMAEYHLDWWNGFNKHHNADIAPAREGLTVHQGGDYLVAAAYFARSGAVRDIDGQSYNNPPTQRDPNHHVYYARDIEWFTVGENLEHIDDVKRTIMESGVIGTALAWSTSFYSSSRNTFYQPRSSTSQPNHAVAIVGWDDAKVTQAPQPGAWLVKNSWGDDWGDEGYFWISYYDKVAGRHPQMGAVAFKNLERFNYSHVYFYDYHGWRATLDRASRGFNAFTANAPHTVSAVSFYTTARDVDYTVRVHKAFADGQLGNEVSSVSGHAANIGMHTVDLSEVVSLQTGEVFYVEVSVSAGGMAYDKTSDVPVLLGSREKAIVRSAAAAGQSYYWNGTTWMDLTGVDTTANLAIKALAIQ